ncbi:hypothetical protein HAX54_016135 [Datura stramonium]|uniref:Uncharacterized protein n=1 Tax=Datura stramonium TaxID=4076 RepID=A0ABS8RZY2_DATST|nr:hypothetical protein [Datura stramonium]
MKFPVAIVVVAYFIISFNIEDKDLVAEFNFFHGFSISRANVSRFELRYLESKKNPRNWGKYLGRSIASPICNSGITICNSGV